MKTVDSQALGIVNRALGLTGAGAPLTEFLDGQVEQTLDIANLVRRGRALVGTNGFFYGVMENAHPSANTLTSTFAPFAPTLGDIPPYPSRMPPGFDIWILSATVDQPSGTGTFTGALLMAMRSPNQAWGIDDNAAAVAAADETVPLAFWDSVATQNRTFGVQESGDPVARIGIRLPRPSRGEETGLTFSSTSSALATFRCVIKLGVFPIGLGQDLLI
ncbi:MAG: hypothetical protein V3T81_10050 [Thermoanaerobaculia bacterium]